MVAMGLKNSQSKYLLVLHAFTYGLLDSFVLELTSYYELVYAAG